MIVMMRMKIRAIAATTGNDDDILELVTAWDIDSTTSPQQQVDICCHFTFILCLPSLNEAWLDDSCGNMLNVYQPNGKVIGYGPKYYAAPPTIVCLMICLLNDFYFGFLINSP
jgi:hypothetical protein